LERHPHCGHPLRPDKSDTTLALEPLADDPSPLATRVAIERLERSLG
jgi:hypothetical protein